jgi:hypothetical protein
MAAPKYLKRDSTSGLVSEVIATETGPASEVVVSTTAGGTIDPSLLPASGAATAVAGENLAAGAFVYIKASDGKLYNATWASGGNQAIGFVLSAFLSTATATYYSSAHRIPLLTSLTTGARYYGDKTTPGGVTTTVPTGAGVLFQFIGYAVSTTAIEVNLSDAIVLAS